MYSMQNAYGELWVKTVDGTIYSAASALSAVYNKYVNYPTIYSQLTANTIKNFEVFNDTLIIDLSGYTVYEKIGFDYDNYVITGGSIYVNNSKSGFTAEMPLP